MTTKEIQQLVCKTQVNKSHLLVCENFSSFFSHELDVVSVSQAGFVYEFEVKVTRADFKKDAEKKKHQRIERSNEKGEAVLQNEFIDRVPNYFSYVCTPGLIKGHEVPEHAGLFYAEGDKLTEIIKAPLIHKGKLDLLTISLRVNRVITERLYLGGCKMTVKNNKIKNNRKTKLEEAGFSPAEIKNYLKR